MTPPGCAPRTGRPSFADHVPTTDALLAERLREAGAIMLGKTNTPEFGAGSHTFNPVFGATRNPWATDRSAGGSSGGAAAALACRMVPLADGSDLGGSLRNPAAWNSVYGLRRPRTGAGMARLGTVDALRGGGPDGPHRDGYGAAPRRDVRPRSACAAVGRHPSVPLPATLEADLRGRRVAWSPSLGGLPIEADVLAVLEPAIDTLAGLGPAVEAAEPDLSGADLVFETWRAYLMALGLGELLAADGEHMKETLRWNIRRGLELDGSRSDGRRSRPGGASQRASTHSSSDYDYLACPVTQSHRSQLESEYPARSRACRWARTWSGCGPARGSPSTCYPAGVGASRVHPRRAAGGPPARRPAVRRARAAASSPTLWRLRWDVVEHGRRCGT